MDGTACTDPAEHAVRAVRGSCLAATFRSRSESDLMSQWATRAGRGRIIAKQQDLGEAEYLLHLDESGRAHVVQFSERPDHLSDGDRLQLELADGRVLTCQVLDSSPFCAIVGDGPLP